MPYKIEKTDAQWKALLEEKGAEPMAFSVARKEATERAFTGKYADHKAKGVYTCICCGKPLFASDAKFDSGTGWPSFFRPVAAENVVTAADNSHGMVREEILCTRCDAHLGHVFRDGPPPTGLRFCVNSVSLKFVPEDGE